MVKFKVIKYKHYLKAVKLTQRQDAGEDVEDEHFRYLLGMVDTWDLVDAETEEPLPVGVEAIDEMTIVQLNEVTEVFNKIFAEKSTVPKASAEHSPSSLTASNLAKNQEYPPPGYQLSPLPVPKG